MPLTPAHLRRLRNEPASHNRLRAARELLEQTQGQTAAALAVTQPQLSDWERGRYGDIGLERARQLADYFGCQIEDLFPAKSVEA